MIFDFEVTNNLPDYERQGHAALTMIWENTDDKQDVEDAANNVEGDNRINEWQDRNDFCGTLQRILLSVCFENKVCPLKFKAVELWNFVGSVEVFSRSIPFSLRFQHF